jgi:hypothetical protein
MYSAASPLEITLRIATLVFVVAVVGLIAT